MDKEILIERLLEILQTFIQYIWAIANYLGIKFAPRDLPIERRMQTLAALAWICFLVFGEIVSIALSVYFIRTDYYWIMLIYIIIIANKRNECNYGSKHWTWARNWRWWYNFRDYFPLKLVKTVDLSPDRNYLFCSFPHGVLSTGCFGSIGTDACGFPNLFPGLTPYLLTLSGHFLVPFFREIISWMGLASASAESINYLLNPKNGKGRCAVLVVGGAAESLYCHSGQYVVVLKNRKGFIKLAMRNGAPLVPMISFGETDLYEQPSNPKGSIVRKIQEWIKHVTGVAPIMPLGRGIFQYSFGIVPQRRPVTTVVGAPMEVIQNVNPTDKEVDEVHQEFIECLVDMFEKEKYKYLPNPNEIVLIVE